MRALIRRVLGLWRATQRRIDLEILWPACREQAGSLEDARDAFAMHAMNDRAWRSLDGEQIVKIIEGLR